MKRIHFLLPGILLLLALPAAAFAGPYDYIRGVVGSIGEGTLLEEGAVGAVSSCSGPGCGFVVIASYLLRSFRPLIITIAGLMITIFGFRMVVGQEDDALQKSKMVISASIAGIVLSFLIEPFIEAFYRTTGEPYRGEQTEAVAIVSREITGIINAALVVAGVLAVTMIIVSALKALTKAGGEEGISGMRRTIFSVVAGILLLVLRGALNAAFGGTLAPTPVPLIGSAIRIIAFLLGFAALAAVTIVIYAGIRMVMSAGETEHVTKMRGLIIRSLLGLVVIVVSYALVQFVIAAATGQ